MASSPVTVDSSPQSVHRFFGISSEIQNEDESLTKLAQQKLQDPPSPTGPVRYVQATRLLFESPVKENWDLVRPKPNGNANSSIRIRRVWFSAANSAVIPPPPLVSTERGRRIRRTVPYYVKVLQAAARRFLVQRDIQAKRESAVRIQSLVRAVLCRMKLKVSSLQRRLEKEKQRKTYSLKWVEDTKREEMARYAVETRKVAHEKYRAVEKDLEATQQIIKDLREQNKTIRAQNKILAKANVIQTDRLQKEQEKSVTIACQTLELEKEITQLLKKNKRLEASSDMYEKFLQEFRESLAEIEETYEVEQKIAAKTKGVLSSMMGLVQDSCEEEELTHEVLKIGNASLFNSTKVLRDKQSNMLNDQVQSAQLKPDKHLTPQSSHSFTETNESESVISEDLASDEEYVYESVSESDNETGSRGHSEMESDDGDSFDLVKTLPVAYTKEGCGVEQESVSDESDEESYYFDDDQSH